MISESVQGKKTMSTGKVVLGVLTGVAVGAILGILFAPDKGSETRKKIAGKGHDMADGLKEKLDSLLAGMTEKFEAAKEEASKLYESGKNHTKDLKKEAKADLG